MSFMTQWYYSFEGQQCGPINEEKLKLLISEGVVKESTLVWTESMTNWAAASSVPELFKNESTIVDSALSQMQAIENKSELSPSIIVGYAWELMKRNFWLILLVGFLFFIIPFAFNFIFGMAIGFSEVINISNAKNAQNQFDYGSLIFQLISAILQTYLLAGFIKIALQVVDGQFASAGMLFGQGGKILKIIGANILFYIAVGLGLLCLIIPGIYIGLKYGQYQYAIVDEDMGIMDAFHYSAKITEGNKMNLMILGLFNFLISLAGILLCGIGLLVALPLIELIKIKAIAYRWMQKGSYQMPSAT